MKNYNCIVTYIGNYPCYYQGYFKNNKPVIGLSFEDALKISIDRKGDAEKIKNHLPGSLIFKVEEHAYIN